jgi:DNA modification methylase
MINLYNGDSRDILKTLEENSIDSCVTDAPYGLTSIVKRFGKENSAPAKEGIDGRFQRLSKGFMGQEWDGSGIEKDPEFWREVYRVVKPGAHLLSFGGTRTYHRIACAIEDAGFEIRDTLMWVYGCLSEDTEILTINGWEQYHRAIDKYPVLCYDINSNDFEFHTPTRSFYYENKHPAYRIKSDFTDQIVSRNHRVLVEREGKFIFQRAETL